MKIKIARNIFDACKHAGMSDAQAFAWVLAWLKEWGAA